MRPTDDDDGEAREEPEDELIAQIVPLRRRHEEPGQRDEPRGEAHAAGDTEEWSVFDPPEDLPLTERASRGRAGQGGLGDDTSGDHPAWSGNASRSRNRLVAFAGMGLTIIAIAALAVLALKGPAGASTRQPSKVTQNARPPVGPSSKATARSSASARHDAATGAKQHAYHRPHYRQAGRAIRQDTTRREVNTTPGGEAALTGTGSAQNPTTSSPASRHPEEFGFER